MNTLSRDTILSALEATAMSGEPPSRLASLLDVGTTDYLNYFKHEILNGLIAAGGATCRFYEGPYGSGKTHLLELIEETALNEGMIVVRTDLDSDLSLENWSAITKYILQNVEMQIRGQVVRSLPLILEIWGQTYRTGLDLLARTPLPHPGYKRAMLMALQRNDVSDRGWFLLRAFLQGEKITVSELKRVGITGIKSPLNQRNAEILLKTVIEGLNLIGIRGIVLLFDENEKTLQPKRNNPSRKQLATANLMRHLIDGCTIGVLPRTLVAFTLLPGFLETAVVYYPALGQRLAMIKKVPGTKRKGAWRWPLLPLEEINTAAEPEEFLEESIRKLCSLVDQCGGKNFNLANKMQIQSKHILDENAGTGYKRDLIKILCSLALQHC